MGLTKFFLLPTSATVIIPATLVSLNFKFSDELVLATYQSYISEDIADQAYNKYSLKTIYFENDKEVFNGFSSGAFDLAILSSSTLEEAIKKKLVKRIDWSKFSSSNISSQLSATGNQQKQWDKVYSPIIQKFFASPSQLGDYGIPYFLSYLAFAYRGEELKSEEQGNSQSLSDKSISWNELIQKITKDPRFSSTDGRPRLGMVEDELTLYSLSKLSNKNSVSGGPQENQLQAVEALFQEEKKQSESDFYRQFMQINESGINKDTLGSRPLFLSPDSAVLSEMLSTGELEGVFFYNGDALYSHQMLEEENEDVSEQSDNVQTQELDDDNSEKKEEIHIISGAPTLWLLDSIAISAQVSPAKEQKIYEFLEQLSFKDSEKISQLNRQVLKGGNDSSGNLDDAKASWLLNNFTEIWYTPVLKTFSAWVKGENGTSAPSPKPSPSSSDEFKKEKEFLYGKNDIEKCLESKAKQTPPNPNNECSIVFERGLSDLQNLNLTLAFERWKSNF